MDRPSSAQAGKSNEFPDWRGEYFAATDLTGFSPELIRNDPAVIFDWGRSGPAPNLLARTASLPGGPGRWSSWRYVSLDSDR